MADSLAGEEAYSGCELARGGAMTCRLCLEDKVLCGSHIISECFHDHIYDKNHRMLPISLQNANKLKFEQKGFREELLCRDCESRLSQWESRLKKDFVDIGNESSNFLSITKVRADILKVENICYDAFKRGLLSLLWRFSLASNPFFHSYRLGPYEEKLRELLRGDGDIPEFHYPVMISKCKLDDQYFPGVIMGFPPGKYSKSVTAHKFIIWGFLVTILVTDHINIEDVQSINLKASGELYVSEAQYTEFAHPDSVIARLFQKDVQAMHDKMK